MACDKTNGDCKPCKDCKDVVPPVLPRCDVALADGVFANAVVTVDGGCIISVQQGDPFLYQPDPCCQVAGGSGGSSGSAAGLKGDKGDKGESASISIGNVVTVSADKPARVTNRGTKTNVVLDFEIPQGASGADGNGDSGDDFNNGGLVIENGVVKEVPAGWLILTELRGDERDINFRFEPSLDKETGIMTLRVNAQGFYETTTKAVGTALAQRDNKILELQNQLASLETKVTALENAVKALQARP